MEMPDHRIAAKWPFFLILDNMLQRGPYGLQNDLGLIGSLRQTRMDTNEAEVVQCAGAIREG